MPGGMLLIVCAPDGLLDPSIRLFYHSLGKTYLIFSGERIVIDRAEKRDVKAPQRSRKREDRR